MTPFWISIALLTIFSVAVVLRPLVRPLPRAAVTDDDAARRLAVYRDRRRELEADRDAGRIDADEARRAIDELAADAASTGVVGAIDAPAAPVAVDGRARTGVAALLAIVVPLVAAAIYLQLGAPALIGMDPQALRQPPGAPELTPEMLDRAIAELEDKARSAPTAETWLMLAQARRMKGDAAGASGAYQQADKLEPGNARLLADWAETVAVAANGDFSGQPLALLERALAAEPTNPKAMAMMGIAQYRLGNPRKGLEYLRALQAASPAGSEQATRIGEVIARIEAEIAGGATGAPQSAGSGTGVAPRAGAPAAGSPSAATASPRAPSDSPAAPSASASASATVPGAAALAPVVSGTITIADALRRDLPGDATVFVVARAPEGPRVPYAVMRLRVSDLPAPFALSDAQAMDPSRKLSEASAIVVEARVSRSGTANRQAGDPIGAVGPVTPGARELRLAIDRTVQAQ